MPRKRIDKRRTIDLGAFDNSDLTECTCSLCERDFFTSDVEKTQHESPSPKYTTDMKDPKTWQTAYHMASEWAYDQSEVLWEIQRSVENKYTLCPKCMQRVKEELPDISI